MKQSLAPVIANTEVRTGVFLMWLECHDIAASVKPGQFVMVGCGRDTLLRRPLSIHQVDTGKLALLFAIVGRGTRWLSERQAGDMVDIFGPLGNGFSIHPDSKNLLLVAGGMGIAPLAFLAETAARRGNSVRMLVGAGTETEVCLGVLPAGADRLIFTEDGTLGECGLVTSQLYLHTAWADQIFACGPMAMYKAMAQMAELKNKPVQISLEMRMGCGFGVCYGCTVKTKSGLKQVCKDGPVFALPDILWDELGV